METTKTVVMPRSLYDVGLNNFSIAVSQDTKPLERIKFAKS